MNRKGYLPVIIFVILGFISLGVFFFLRNKLGLNGNSSSSEKNYSVQKEPVFDPSFITYLIPVRPSDNYAFFVKDKSLIRIDLYTKQKELFAVLPDKPLSYDISKDQTKIIYSVRNRKTLEEYSYSTGDTLYLYDIKSRTRTLLYEDKEEKQLEIRTLKFFDQDKKVIFTTNAINTVSLETKKISTFMPLKKTGFCRTYFAQEINADNKAIIMIGCYEGRSQKIVDLNTEKEIGNFDNGYVEGGDVAEAFIGNNQILGYKSSLLKEEYVTESPMSVKFQIYNYKGKTVKSFDILERNEYPSDIKIEPDNFISLLLKKYRAEGNTKISYKKFSLATGETIDLSPSLKLLSTIEDKYSGTSQLWLTNYDFTNPIILDKLLPKNAPIIIRE